MVAASTKVRVIGLFSTVGVWQARRCNPLHPGDASRQCDSGAIMRRSRWQPSSVQVSEGGGMEPVLPAAAAPWALMHVLLASCMQESPSDVAHRGAEDCNNLLINYS